jgi:putative ABC transport system permease protein
LDKLSFSLTQQGSVISTAVISNLPGGGSSDINVSSGMQIIGISEFNEGMFYSVGIDAKVIPLLEMTILYGRNFNENISSDKRVVIVNESFFKKLGVQVTEQMIGQKIRFGRNQSNPTYEIIGILKDSNRTSLEKEIEPTIYFYDWGYGGGHGYGNMMIKCHAANVEEAIRITQQKWNEFFPNEVFRYEFLDDRFASLYIEDQRFSKIFTAFSLLAVFITMMGLFGLSSFMAAQRTKEVGIRRVLGASVGNILFVFFYDIIRLIFLSLLIGVPLVFLSMSNWLEGYAYHINFPLWTFLVSLFVLVFLSFFTISYQTLKTAFLNPVQSLRSE